MQHRDIQCASPLHVLAPLTQGAPAPRSRTKMGDNRWLKNSFIYLIILVAALALFFQYFNTTTNPPDERGIYQVLEDAKDGKVAKIQAQSGSDDIVVIYTDKTRARSR